MSANNRVFPGMTGVYSRGALTATGAETVFDTTVSIHYSIGGKMYIKTAITDGVTPTTDHNTGVAFKTLTGTTTSGKACVFVWGLNAGGDVKVCQGPVVDTDASGNIEDPGLFFPAVKDDIAPFAYMVAKHAGTASTITFGSSNWNATGFTNTIVNVAQLPDRPV